MIYQAAKIRGCWVVRDTLACVDYFPPRGTDAREWATRKAQELNNVKG